MAKIMVVDDDSAIGDLFKRILERESYRIIVAHTGEDCLGIIKKEGIENIRLVFLDLRMPGMGGEKAFLEN